MAVTVTIGQKYGLPQFSEDSDFDHWTHEVEMWQLITDLPKEKHGLVLYLSLNQKVRQACASLTKDELNKPDGLDKLIEKLRELYAVSEDQAMFNAYEKFETFRRPETMNITDYINEFEQLNQKLISYKIELPPAILAYQLLKNANLPKEKRDLARATTTELTYNAMKKQIKAIYDLCVTKEASNDDQDEILVQSDNVFYSRGNWRNRGSWRGNRNGRGRAGNYYNRNQATSSRTRGKNPLDANGYPTKCYVCQSTFHYAKDCPDNDEKSQNVQEVHIQLFTEKVEQCYLEQVVSESLNCALIDTGCSSNVCGKNWLRCYRDTLSDKSNIEEIPSDKLFKFGASKAYPSMKQVNLPANIGGQQGYILTDVVDCEIPLLLSKNSLKTADSQLDFVNDTITMYGKEINLQHTSNGHYCIPLTPKQVVVNNIDTNSQPNVKITLFSESDSVETKTLNDKYNVALKLHKQFGHPVDSGKLKKLLQNSQINDKELMKQIDIVTEKCDICNRYMKARARPVVSLPLAQDFNDCLAMDLKFLTINGKSYTILHMIDVFTRFSAAVLIKSKHKENIVDSILRHWVAIFGTPQSILSDNGGEFNNDLIRDVAELLNTRVTNTAAESPWSNGIVERHNAIIENMVLKIIDDMSCSVENALVWAVSAKNALHNNLGYSPNQLVFGRNPNIPSILTAKPPALRTVTSSKLIAEHLNALHAARKAFIKAESSRKIKLALNHQTRNTTSKVFNNGDHVYYKRNNSKEWRGPGTILGIDGKQILVRHGGTYVRVSPCSVAKVKCDENDSTTHHKTMNQNKQQTPEIMVMANDETEETTQNDKSPDMDDTETTESTKTKELKKPTKHASTVKMPKVRERISLVDPDSNLKEEYIVINRAGKAGGAHKYWMNVKHLTSGIMKSIDFENITDWTLLEDEVLYTENNNIDIINAQKDELEKWKEYNVYDEVDDTGQEVITTRWVITEKTDNGTTRIKARLVARGYEEDSSDIRTDSPTITKENIRLVSTVAVNNNWKIYSLDVKAAFLQGFEIDRVVHLLPPPEAGTNKLWKLNTAVYGLCDASRAWYLKISDELKSVGVQQSIYDNALCYFRLNGKLEGLICCHVDDFFFCGSQLFHETVIDHIRMKFSLSKESESSFRYLGVEIKQDANSIIMHQHDYISKMEPMKIKHMKPSRPLTQDECRNLKALIGQEQWVAKQTRPDISFATCELSTNVKKATTSDVQNANKQLQKLQQEIPNSKIVIANIEDICQASIIVYSDASHANLRDHGSQGGFIIFLYGRNNNVCPIIWKSHRLKRVVKSAMAAETMALLEAAEHAMLIKTIIGEIHNIDATKIPIICITDSKSLYEASYTTNVLEDKRLHIDICAIREMLSRKEIHSIKWTEAANQLADCLTKGTSSSDKMLKVIAGEDPLPAM